MASHPPKEPSVASVLLLVASCCIGATIAGAYAAILFWPAVMR
ncbi:hypothetical protein FHS76_003485 [Ochrobactrum daejeonense]|uniref:Lipoprotein n=1 Tax=Brucella daejeonensis TaxID=659015 RepID=A0A7W9AZP3_9HYPH|nr:hypothetical protein [Brucella daejeonensis]MBB5703578.1 hypothetical protein [Brucella daejeonensis]